MSLLPPMGVYLAFIAAAAAIVLLPGPDTITVLSQGATRGRRAGVETAVGVSTGVLVHASAVALGLAALLKAVPAAYTAIKWLGAAYLLYLGAQTLRSDDLLDSGGEHAAADDSNGTPTTGAFRAGFLVNATNPKVAIFFLAFLPAFAGSGPNTGVRILVLGLTYSVLSGIYLCTVGAAAGSVQAVLDSPRATRGLRLLSGTALIVLAILVAAGVGP